MSNATPTDTTLPDITCAGCRYWSTARSQYRRDGRYAKCLRPGIEQRWVHFRCEHYSREVRR